MPRKPVGVSAALPEQAPPVDDDVELPSYEDFKSAGADNVVPAEEQPKEVASPPENSQEEEPQSLPVGRQGKGFTEIEKEAREKGWMPKEDYLKNPDNDPEEWRNARDFMKFGSLFDRLESTNKTNKELANAVNFLQKQMKDQADYVKKRTIEEYQLQRSLAIQSGDETKVNELDRSIQIEQNNLNSATNAAHEMHIKNVVDEWKTKNANWFNEDNPENYSMKAYAIKYEADYIKTHPTDDPEKGIAEAEKAVKIAFPHRFQNPNRYAPSGAERSGANRSARAGITFGDLDSFKQRMVKTMAAVAKMSVDEYMKEAIKIGAIR